MARRHSVPRLSLRRKPPRPAKMVTRDSPSNANASLKEATFTLAGSGETSREDPAAAERAIASTANEAPMIRLFMGSPEPERDHHTLPGALIPPRGLTVWNRIV